MALDNPRPQCRHLTRSRERNLADSLRRQSIKVAPVWKGSVHHDSEVFMRQLRISKEDTKEDTQGELNRILGQNHTIISESKISDSDQILVQDTISVQDKTKISVEGREQKHQVLLPPFSRRM